MIGRDEERRRRVPSVDRLAARYAGSGVPRMLVVDLVRSVVAGAGAEAGEEEVLAQLDREVHRLGRARLAEVVNATGVLLHTNLGRAPLHPDAVEAAAEVARSYANLELTLESGRRGGRGLLARCLLQALTGAEDALVVHNNAGGLFLALSALGTGGEVVVSRGELVEIGGSYRLPDIMRAAGVRLVEVGTTNTTRLGDYAAAVTDETALVLKVHPSNFTVQGFTASVPVAELAAWSATAGQGVPVVFDAGSGLLDNRLPWWSGPPPAWLGDEPGVRQAVDAGVDLVLFSGDKLFGGPQAGIAVGRGDLVERMRASPVARALRIDGPSLAALTVTAGLYADGRGAELPLWAMAAESYEALQQRAEWVVKVSGAPARVETGHSTPGAGSAPGARMESPVIAVEGDVDGLYQRLLDHPVLPVLGRREAGHLVLDLRAVPAALDGAVADALGAACRS